MKNISQSDFDQFVSHTIRIEIMNGVVLIYYVTAESKVAFENILQDETYADLELDFLWIYHPHDRITFINKKEIIRITFCFDLPADVQYFDNFQVKHYLGEEDDEYELQKEDIPQLIIMHNRQMEDTELVKGVTMKTDGYYGNVSFYSSLDKGDIEGFEFDYFEETEEFELLTYNYLQFIDDDGERNYMPLHNISVVEVERPLLMTNKLLDIYLGKKSK